MERLICKGCEAEYEVTLVRLETQEQKDESCEACGEHLWSWDRYIMPVFTRVQESQI